MYKRPIFPGVLELNVLYCALGGEFQDPTNNSFSLFRIMLGTKNLEEHYRVQLPTHALQHTARGLSLILTSGPLDWRGYNACPILAPLPYK